jgi:hypothetical protein
MKPIKLKTYSQTARTQGIYRHSFKIALLVGTVLNLINQPQLFLGLYLNDFNAIKDINYLKVLLTYMVPYFVSLYGALSVLDIPMVNNQNQTR